MQLWDKIYKRAKQITVSLAYSFRGLAVILFFANVLYVLWLWWSPLHSVPVLAMATMQAVFVLTWVVSKALIWLLDEMKMT